MDYLKFKIFSIFNELDHNIDMSSFEGRLIFQKEIYLLQEIGIALGCSYGWYKRGPYSSYVADQGFHLNELKIGTENVPIFASHELVLLRKYRAFFDDAISRFKHKDTAFILELLASLHFIIKYGYPKPKTYDEAITNLNYKKPIFEGYGRQAIELLQKHGMIM